MDTRQFFCVSVGVASPWCFGVQRADPGTRQRCQLTGAIIFLLEVFAGNCTSNFGCAGAAEQQQGFRRASAWHGSEPTLITGLFLQKDFMYPGTCCQNGSTSQQVVWESFWNSSSDTKVPISQIPWWIWVFAPIQCLSESLWHPWQAKPVIANSQNVSSCHQFDSWQPPCLLCRQCLHLS